MKKYIYVIFSIILLNIIVKLFIVEIYRINGNSMNNTLLDGDYVLIYKLNYGCRLPNSILDIPIINLFSYITLSNNTINKIEKKDNKFKQIKISNASIGDIIAFNLPPYQKNACIKRIKSISKSKDNWKYFVVGDNKEQSTDSRTWGEIEENQIIGKATYIILSIDPNKKPRYNRIGKKII